jgi:argininosuccinate lyase
VTVWASRVATPLDERVWAFLKADDAELLPYDCRASLVHAQRLAAAGLLGEDELGEVQAGLARIEAAGTAALRESDEDVHSAIERELGEVGRKLQAGRSRNDQVAAAMRLYVADACAEAVSAIEELAGVILDRAEQEAETPLPGYTHLQRAQPVTVGHHLLAWVEMLDRDRARFTFAAGQAEPSPLGAGALAGSTLPLPAPPKQLRNSLDAVADRDFAVDYLYACAVLFSHLSRVGEELCVWATSEFSFVRLPEEAATGSSMMPQKLNPDVAELVRGKAGTALGRLTGLLAVMKGLPLAYDRDLQEDKPAVFAARRDVAQALPALGVLIAGIAFDGERLENACADPLLLATDAAERLVIAGVPFRDAHEQVAGEVRAGTFSPAAVAAPRPAPGPGGVRAALAEARMRFGARTVP